MIRKVYPVFLFFLAGIAFWGVKNPLLAQRPGGNSKISIRLEIFCDGQLQPMEAQQWGRELSGAGFQSVQVRAGASADALDIQPLGSGFYSASGMLTKNNQLLLTGGRRFSLSECRQVKPYLEEKILEMEQAEAEEKEEKAAEGVQDVLLRELSVPVGFRTKGFPRKLVFKQMLQSFRIPIRVPSSLKKAFDDEDLVEEELKGVARGTALAYVLRYIGYCVQPERAEDQKNGAAGANGGLSLRIVSAPNADAKKMIPIGYAAPRATVDELSESFEANVDGASAKRVLDSLQDRLDVPFLYDYNSMAGLGIEPADVVIHQKPGKFTYSRLLNAVLFQAQLQREIRVDEAGNVFFWITTMKSAD
ncbi:MAG: hypothetical protein K6C40_08705 [Thermoguttaceae bacterium]|nr:hypothetical protein [Thermoguttaceae bacterium]